MPFEIGIINLIPPEGEARGNHRFAVAQYICAPSTAGYSVPITFDCALACTAIGWPMQMGILYLTFARDPSTCPSVGTGPSRYIPQPVTMGLGCLPQTPVPEGIWQGEANISSILIAGTPSYGMSWRFRAVMTVNTDASLGLSVTMERLVPAVEFSPPPADGSNTYVTCGTFGVTLTRILDPLADPLDRNTTWVMGHPDPIPFTPSGGYCETDIKSATATIQLMPYRLGCNGKAENGPLSDCSMDTGKRTYSCLAALVKPAVAGTFRPQWSQLGVNRTGGRLGCFRGNNSGSGLLPPVAANLSPTPIYPSLADLLNTGCGGEDPVNGAEKQQIQYTSVAGFDLVVKSVAKGAPCVAIRIPGGAWTVGTYTLDLGVLADTGHWVATVTFGGVAGNPVVILYGLEFPSGVTAECVDNAITPSAMVAPMEPAATYQMERLAIIERMKTRAATACVHLGMLIDPKPACGCSALHSCTIHGECVRFGAQGSRFKSCSDCTDYRQS